MSIQDDVTVSGSCIVLTILKNPRLARVYKPEEVGELIEALAYAAERALDNRRLAYRPVLDTTSVQKSSNKG